MGESYRKQFPLKKSLTFISFWSCRVCRFLFKAVRFIQGLFLLGDTVMLFCDFYKKLKKAIGDTEFRKLPPVKGWPYQKIFMLMTLSCNDKSKGNCGAELNKLHPQIKDKFQALKNDLENLKVNLQELKKELKDTESLVNDEEIRESFKKLKKTITITKLTDNTYKKDGYFTIKFNDILDTLTDRFDKKGYRTVIDSIFKVTEVIPEDSLMVTLDFKDLKDLRYFNDSLIDNIISNLNKDIDNINKSLDDPKKEKYDIPRYSKYLGVSLKNDFPDYWQIAEYIKYLYLWRSYESKNQTFKDYCIKRKASISKFAQKITPYLVSHPYFIDVINNLSDEQKGKIYEEFHEELKVEIESLDFLGDLGEKLAALLKKIIEEAANEDLQILEKLWEKEEDNFLEMVLYPILYELFGHYSDTDYMRYGFYLKISNEKNKVIIENHPDTFLDNLFFFIAKKKKIFYDDSKLKNILPNPVYIGGIVDKRPIMKGLPLVRKPLRYFTGEEKSFTDIDQILEFKKTLKNDEIYDFDNSFVVIVLTRSCENPLLEYSKKNMDKIGRNLRYENPKKYEEHKRFWEEKRTSELYNYIHEKLKTEEAQSHISTRFQRLPLQNLRNYYLRGECPAYGYIRYIMERAHSGEGS